LHIKLEAQNSITRLSIFVLLLGLFANCGDLNAQDEAMSGQQEDAGANSPAHGTGSDPGASDDNDGAAKETPEDSAKDVDHAADVRDAINENLLPPVKQKESDEVQPTSPQEPVDEVQEEYWYTRFESVTHYVQTMPDRIPGLAGKGWLHFGRIELEYGYFSEGILKDDTGFNIRSLRGGVVRKVNERLTVKLEIDATDGDSNFSDLYARFNTRLGLFTLGNQKIAQTLVNQTSRLSRTFMEEPLPADAFGLGRRLGVGWDFHLNKVGAHLTAFGPDLNEDIGKFGYGVRLYTSPTKTRFSMFHLGVSAVREQMDRDARFRAYPETRVTNIRLVDTGRQSDVDEQTIFGLELAGARDSYSIRAEYFFAQWDRKTAEDTQFQGFYVQANWAITGEAFQYAQGKFLRIRPRSHRGAWEVAARYSLVDLNDEEVLGGAQRNISLALNWYGPGRQLRVMGALIYVETDAVAGDQSPLIAQARVQLHW
jgi:phosphate-selective porin OprO/OprP